MPDEELEKWMKNNGAPSPVVEITTFQETGRGMRARNDIMSSACIVRIPRQLMITRSYVFDKGCPPWKPFRNWFSEHGALAGFICLLRTKSPLLKQSVLDFWEVYLGSLPVRFDTLFFEDSLRSSKAVPSHILAIVEGQETAIARNFAVFVKVMSASGADTLINRSDFAWAWFVVNTRCVSLTVAGLQWQGDTKQCDTMALAPFLDMFNHSPTTRVRIVADSPSGDYCIETLGSWKKGNQVFIHYGDHDNWHLYAEYGFAVPGNTLSVDVSGLFARTFSEDDTQFQWKWQVLRELGLIGPETLVLPPTYALKMSLALMLAESRSCQAEKKSAAFKLWSQAYYSGNDPYDDAWVRNGFCAHRRSL